MYKDVEFSNEDLLVLESNPISVIKKRSISQQNVVRERALDITLEPGSGLPTSEETTIIMATTDQKTSTNPTIDEQTESSTFVTTAITFEQTTTNFVDYCSPNLNRCPINSTCVNLATNFTCNCYEGFNFNAVIIFLLLSRPETNLFKIL